MKECSKVFFSFAFLFSPFKRHLESNLIQILKVHGKQTQIVQNIMEVDKGSKGKFFSGCLIHQFSECSSIYIVIFTMLL